MAISSSSPKGVVVTVPVLVLSLSAAAIFLFFLLSSLSSCSCPTGGGAAFSDSGAAVSAGSAAVGSVGGSSDVRGGWRGTVDRISATGEDIEWVKNQIRENRLQMQDNVLRKGINPRTRAQQLQDLIEFKGISHYEGEESNNNTALPCPGELLVEEHHSNYGEPWAGGRDVFEFLAESIKLSPDSCVLEIGCGTLRVGLHFIRYLNPEHFHCLERDELSLMAAFRYELPSQGLLPKRPLIVRGEDMDLSRFGSGILYDLIYASAVFLHMPDKLVWVGLERLVNRLKPYVSRIFVLHNIKFCSRLGGEGCTKRRLGGEGCTKRLASLGLDYLGKHTHDSLLFNH